MKKRIHLLSAVNAKAVTKAGDTYTIRDVCGATDGLVMNGMLYAGSELAKAASGLAGKPAPAGHPKNGAGQFISAANGDALLTHYIGSVCTNARHESGRTLVDIVVNAAQAKALPAGAALLQRLDAALDGTNTEPIHVSTGLYCEAVEATGESRGKKYARIATNIAYDHLAILLNEKGAGTPDDGVGMWLNAATGEAEEVETGETAELPEDRRSTGLMSHIRRLLRGNAADVSFDAIYSALSRQLPQGSWLHEVYDKYAIWCDEAGTCWRRDYSVASDGSVAFSGEAVEVVRRVSYEVATNAKEPDSMKTQILAALNAAGIKIDGLDDDALLSAYRTLCTKPVQDKLDAANSKVAEFEGAARAAEEAEVKTLATELAVNSSLTVEDLAKLGKARLIELKSKAAPVVTGNSGGKPADEFAGYDINAAA